MTTSPPAALETPADERDPSLPPHSPQAEEAVLGSILKDGHAIVDVAPFLKPEHFYVPRYRHGYAAIAALFDRGERIDYTTIAEELRRQGTYAAAGGLLFLAAVNLGTPTAAHIEHYARIVVEHAVRRRYISAAQTVAELAWDVRRDLGTVKDRAEALVLGAASDTLSRKMLFRPGEWTASLMTYLSEAQTDGLAGVSTGLRDLDRMTLGLSKGWLYLLGARPGTGKTGLAGQIALHVGQHHGPVAFVSMELNEKDLGVRFLSVLTNIAKERIVTRDLADRQWQDVLTAAERLERSRVHIAFGAGFTSADVRAFALQVQATEGIPPALVVVDYLQLLQDQEGDGRNRERNVSVAARSLKALAHELQVPLLACAQFNRNLDGRSDKRPSLTDLRDSGELENVADSVLGLYREEMHHPDTDQKHVAEVIVLKKRQLGDDIGTTRRFVWVGESYRDYAQQ
jgi:replicative DNA helicase